MLARDHGERGFSVGGLEDLESVDLEQPANQLAGVIVVFDQQDRCVHSGACITMVGGGAGGRRMIRKILETEPSLAPTVARVCAGTVMFAHGAQKMLGWFGGMGWDGTMRMMTGGMGLSSAVVTLVILAEFLG